MSDSPSPDSGSTDEGTVTTIVTPIRVDYRYTAGLAQSRFLKGISEGRFLGQRCPRCKKVYVPARGSCPTDGVATTDEVELPDTGTVTTYCVVNVPFAGQSIELPYICAQVLLDGADISFMGLVQEIPADEVRMGLRVQAVWVDRSQLVPNMTSVKYFRPTGEPDAPYESFSQYL
ncbi:MAG TPA: Zn-ribbon domain-containing OB-fold protein [Acidimicrobiales bacterium]|nr:Zn-ribbon domain-containing OB-fold protein [Acidimicrobiales bacterium]